MRNSLIFKEESKMYRTRTYLAGDWDGDKDIISIIQQWNKSENWALDYSDAHILTQARDSSLPCSIKRSLLERLNASKTFVLIVGRKTKEVTKGSCQYCSRYSGYYKRCTGSMSTDLRSFVEYECEKAEEAAIEGHMKIVVIYNSAYVYKERCPECLKGLGIHIPGKIKYNDGTEGWNYKKIKQAIMYE